MINGCYVIKHTEDKSDLIIEVKKDLVIDIPDEQQNLAIDIANTLDTIKLLYEPKTKEFSNAFEQLFGLAKIGLEISPSQPSLAIKALIQFKKEIVDRESGKKKNEYLKELGKKSLIGCLPLLISGSLINYYSCKVVQLNCIQLNYLASILILVSGTMVGVWLSFAISRTYISFDELAIIEKDRLEPYLRLIFTGILSIIFGLLFIKHSIEIKLGGLSSQDIINDPITAFLIGTILGMNEKIIGNTLTKKTSEILNNNK